MTRISITRLSISIRITRKRRDAQGGQDISACFACQHKYITTVQYRAVQYSTINLRAEILNYCIVPNLAAGVPPRPGCVIFLVWGKVIAAGWRPVSILCQSAILHCTKPYTIKYTPYTVSISQFLRNDGFRRVQIRAGQISIGMYQSKSLNSIGMYQSKSLNSKGMYQSKFFFFTKHLPIKAMRRQSSRFTKDHTTLNNTHDEGYDLLDTGLQGRGPKIVFLAPEVGHRLVIVNLTHQI